MPDDSKPPRAGEQSSLLDKPKRASLYAERPSPSKPSAAPVKPSRIPRSDTIIWRKSIDPSSGQETTQVEKYDAQRLLWCFSSWKSQVWSLRALGASVLEGKTVIMIGTAYAAVAATFCIIYLLKPVESKNSLQDTMDALETFLDLTVTGVMLLLGQFVSQTLSRWWDIRTRGIGNLWGAINDLSMWASAWWPKEGGSQQAARALVLRYGLLAMDLLFRQGRGEDGPAYMAELVAKGLLEPHEAAVLAPLPSKSQVVISWLTLFWTRVFQDDGLDCALPSWPDPTRFNLVMGKCAEARGAIGLTLAYTDTQLPFAYVHLLASVTHLTLLVNALFSGCTLGRTLHDSQDIKMEGGYDVFILLVFVKLMRIIFMPLLLVGLLHLGVRMENPLERKANNFPGAAYLEYMSAECEAFAKANRAVSIEHGWWANCVTREEDMDAVLEGGESRPESPRESPRGSPKPKGSSRATRFAKVIGA